jgi:hypothetical protein
LVTAGSSPPTFITSYIYNVDLLFKYLHYTFKGALFEKMVNFCFPKKLSDMIDALIKRVSVTYNCYEMYAHRGKNGATARVLRSIKKWTPSY